MEGVNPEICLQKKKQCLISAKEAVENLLELDITETILLKNIQYLSQSYYEDVIEERSISEICGYPICKNKLKPMTNKKYQISCKTNKIYDLTERKMFCSNKCYTASKYLKDQIPTSPVWLLETTEYQLLQETKYFKPGEEIKLDIEKLKIHDKPHEEQKVIENFAVDALNTLREMGGKCWDNLNIFESKINTETDNKKDVTSNTEEIKISKDDDKNSEKTVKKKSVRISEKVEEKLYDPESTVTCLEESAEKSTKDDRNEYVKPIRNTIENIVIIEKNVNNNQEIESSIEIGKDNINSSSEGNILSDITSDIPESKSIETHEVVNNIVITSVNETSMELKSLNKETVDDSSLKQKETYDPVNKAVRILKEWFTEKSKKSILEYKPQEFYAKPEPTVEELKVQAYLSGKTTVDVNLGNLKHILPDLDKHEQLPMRRRIVIKKLSEVYPELLNIFKITEDYTMEVHELIESFNLQANNIMMKPAEWNIIALFTLQLMCHMKPSLQVTMHRESNKKRLRKILKSINFSLDQLHSLVNDLIQ